MNRNTKLIFGAYAAAWLTATLVAQQQRIRDLELQLHVQKRVAQVWKREFQRAAEKLTVPQLMQTLQEQQDDLKFDNLVRNFNKD